jgi:ribosome-binding factor A
MTSGEAGMAGRRRNRPPPVRGERSERERSQRQLRVGEALRHALAAILCDGECRDPALTEASITVTEVRVSPDLRDASVFVMPLGGLKAPEALAGLERSAGFLRSRLARDVPLRFAPRLVFSLDSSFDAAARIGHLLASPAVKRDLGPPPGGGERGEDGG